MLRAAAAGVLLVAAWAVALPVGKGATTTTTVDVSAVYPAEQLPSGSALFLRGSRCGLSWDYGVQLARNAADRNVWVGTLVVSVGDLGQWLDVKVLVDDKAWSLGANTQLWIPPTPPASPLPLTVYPWFSARQGRYETIYGVASKTLGNVRNIATYLPPSFDENYLKQYPVLIAQDGQNLFNVSTSAFGTAWLCQDTLDAMIMGEAIEEIVMVGVDNAGAERIDEYTYSRDPQYGGGKADVYLDFVEQTVLPLAASRYRTLNGSRHTGILGSSLGGLLSCYAGWTRPHVYGRAGCMSSSFWWNGDDFNNTVLTASSGPDPAAAYIYVDSGSAPGAKGGCTAADQDDCQETLAVADHLQRLGWVLNQNLFYYRDIGGQHSEKYWGARFDKPMAALYGQR